MRSDFAKGTRTKRRSNMRGCGTCSSGVAMVSGAVKEKVQIDQARTFWRRVSCCLWRFDGAETLQ